jgi:hypothetical protein
MKSNNRMFVFIFLRVQMKRTSYAIVFVILIWVALMLLFLKLHQDKLASEEIIEYQPPPADATVTTILTTTPRTPQDAYEHREKSFCRRLPRIHLPIPATTRNLRGVQSIQQLPLVAFALSSLITSSEPTLFQYGVDVGGDSGDPYFDNLERTASITAWWRDAWMDYWGDDPCLLPPLRFFVYNNTHSRNVWASNFMAQRAYEEGYDYYFRINDDTVLHNNRWSSVFVATLSNMRPITNLGVTGPADSFTKNKLLTHSFVHRNHFNVHGFLFPFSLPNYFSDDWHQNVYAPPYPESFGVNASMMKIHLDIPVTHKLVTGRYEIQSTPEKYKAQLAIDRDNLRVYIEKRVKLLKS